MAKYRFDWKDVIYGTIEIEAQCGNDAEEILDEWIPYKRQLYVKRRDYILKKLRKELDIKKVFDEDIPLVLEKLEHAYKVTKEQVNYKVKL